MLKVKSSDFEANERLQKNELNNRTRDQFTFEDQ